MYMKNNYYQKNPSVVCTELDDGGILLDLDTKYYYTLNQTGLRLWQIMDEKKSSSEIARQITNEYEVEEKNALESVLKLIKKLEKENLIIPLPIECA